jgi:hypothetical protein
MTREFAISCKESDKRLERLYVNYVDFISAFLGPGFVLFLVFIHPFVEKIIQDNTR